MANVLFGYRLKEANKTTDVASSMKAATYGSQTDKARLYYLELYANRDTADTGGTLRIDGVDIQLTFQQNIVASLDDAVYTGTAPALSRESSLEYPAELPLFRKITFGTKDAQTDKNTLRFTAGHASGIDGSGAYPNTGAGIEISAGQTKTLGYIKLDINDGWNTNSTVAAPSPAISAAGVNLDGTVITTLNTAVASDDVVQSLRTLRNAAADASSYAEFVTGDKAATTIARAKQELSALSAGDVNADDAFAQKIGTTRTAGLAASVTTNLVRKGTTFTDSAVLQNTGESTLTSVEAVKTGTITGGTYTLAFLERTNRTAEATTVSGTLNQASTTAQALSDVNYKVSDAGVVTEKGEIVVTKTLTVDGAVGTALIQNDAGGVEIRAYADSTTTKGVIKKIAGTTSKNLITYEGDLNYDGRVSMKDLAFLNVGAQMNKAGAYRAEVDANHDKKFDINDLTTLNSDWGKTLHLKTEDAGKVDDGTGTSTTTNRSYAANAQISWAELMTNGSYGAAGAKYTWDDTTFADQSKIEALSTFVGTLQS